jgi:hypothetical protein
MSVLWRLPFVLGHGVRRHLTVLSPPNSRSRCSIQRQEKRTVNFRPALVSFSACLLENTDPNSRENNVQLRLSLALEALSAQQRVFPPLSWQFVFCVRISILSFSCFLVSTPCFLVDGSTFHFFLCVCTEALCSLSSSSRSSATASDWN